MRSLSLASNEIKKTIAQAQNYHLDEAKIVKLDGVVEILQSLIEKETLENSIVVSSDEVNKKIKI